MKEEFVKVFLAFQSKKITFTPVKALQIIKGFLKRWEPYKDRYTLLEVYYYFANCYFFKVQNPAGVHVYIMAIDPYEVVSADFSAIEEALFVYVLKASYESEE